jgi:hypothetical protein
MYVLIYTTYTRPCQSRLSAADHALSLVVAACNWVSCYTMSGWTNRENVFQCRIQGNVCLSTSDGLFPTIYLHWNVFTELLLSSGWFLDCDWQLAWCRYIVANSAWTNGRWSCHDPCWSASAWFNVGGSNSCNGCGVLNIPKQITQL